jgi:hypothetical protein
MSDLAALDPELPLEVNFGGSSELVPTAMMRYARGGGTWREMARWAWEVSKEIVRVARFGGYFIFNVMFFFLSIVKLSPVGLLASAFGLAWVAIGTARCILYLAYTFVFGIVAFTSKCVVSILLGYMIVIWRFIVRPFLLFVVLPPCCLALGGLVIRQSTLAGAGAGIPLGHFVRFVPGLAGSGVMHLVHHTLSDALCSSLCIATIGIATEFTFLGGVIAYAVLWLATCATTQIARRVRRAVVWACAFLTRRVEVARAETCR